MLHKMNHDYTFMLNAEHNCRLIKYPFVEEEDDGNYHAFDDIWAGTKSKSGNIHTDKMHFVLDGFNRYIEGFYYKSEVNYSEN